MKANRFKNVNLVPIFVIYASITGTLSFLLLFGVFLQVGKVASQKAPVLLETSDGTSIVGTPVDPSFRSPRSIKNFVRHELGGLCDMTGTLSPSEPGDLPLKDPGVPASSGKKITTAAWQAGFGISEGFRRSYLDAIAEHTPQAIFEDSKDTNNSQARLVIGPDGIGEPQQIAPGKWKVPVVAKLLVFENGDNLGVVGIAFNKAVFVQRVDIKPLPDNPTPLDYAIFNARKAGLEIYSMPDLDLGLRTQ